MTANAVVESLIDHFNRTWDMLREAIEALPEDQWRAGDVEQFVPARQALPVVTIGVGCSVLRPRGRPLAPCDGPTSRPPHNLPPRHARNRPSRRSSSK